MKMLILFLSMFSFLSVLGQTKEDETSVKKVVKSFIKSGDDHNVGTLKSVLHNSYRLVWYGGKDAPFIADKSAFISKIAKKEWGGDERDVTVEHVEVFDGINATAKVISDGMKTQMRSMFSLIKVDGEWKIIGELVNATFK